MSTRRQLSRLKRFNCFFIKITFLICLINVLINFTNAMILNETLLIRQEKPGNFKHRKFSIDELLHTQFDNRVSDDIDMDPCKSGK